MMYSGKQNMHPMCSAALTASWKEKPQSTRTSGSKHHYPNAVQARSKTSDKIMRCKDAACKAESNHVLNNILYAFDNMSKIKVGKIQIKISSLEVLDARIHSVLYKTQTFLRLTQKGEKLH